MTKQNRSIFRRMIDVGRNILGLSVVHHYQDFENITEICHRLRVGPPSKL